MSGGHHLDAAVHRVHHRLGDIQLLLLLVRKAISLDWQTAKMPVQPFLMYQLHRPSMALKSGLLSSVKGVIMTGHTPG